MDHNIYKSTYMRDRWLDSFTIGRLFIIILHSKLSALAMLSYVWWWVVVAVICVKQHNDKKPLEGYDNNLKCVHRWLPNNFFNAKNEITYCNCRFR